MHLNLDFNINNHVRSEESSTRSGVILGYSQPLSYPTRFDRTLVAQIGYRANDERGKEAVTTLGVGLRQQLTPQSVFDVGFKSDVSGGKDCDVLQLVAGYRKSF